MSRLETPNRLLRGAVAMRVPTVTLDDQLVEGPDWLVIDVEGFELRVLRGARRTIDRCRGIVVEVHPDDWSVAGTTREDFKRLLDECHLRMRPLSGTGDPLGRHGHVVLEHVA